MKRFFKLNILLISLLVVSCNSIASFNFRIKEEGTPTFFDPTHPDADSFGYVPAQPGYDQDFDFNITKIDIIENAVLNYWQHVLVLEFEVKNNKDERSLLPEVGIVLLNEEETQFEPNYFVYPYFSGTYYPKLNYFQNSNETSILPVGSLASKEKLRFISKITLSQNSNEKLEGLYFLHFLRLPSVNANNKNSTNREVEFILENSVFSLRLNMSSIYEF